MTTEEDFPRVCIECHRYWGGWWARVLNRYGRVLHETAIHPSMRDARFAARFWVRRFWS